MEILQRSIRPAAGLGAGALAGVVKGALTAGAVAETSGDALAGGSSADVANSSADAASDAGNVLADSSTSDGAAVSANDGAAISGENLGLTEFPKATGADQVLAKQLGTAAAAEGYRAPAYYAVNSLQDPAQIEQFARMYTENYGDVATNNMKFAVEDGRIQPGTEDIWNAAIAKASDIT